MQLNTERITPDNSYWLEQLPKLSLFWRICILPEIMGRWCTRKLGMKPPGGLQVDGDCYCRLKTSEETVTCSNISCPVSRFIHHAKVPKTWYCPHCRKMPEFQPRKRVKIPKVEETSEAMTIHKICICEKKAESTDKLLKCHNENCSHGPIFICWGTNDFKQCQKRMGMSILLCLNQENCS